jgi:hypothetical protein
MLKLIRGRRLRFLRGAIVGGALVYFLDPEQGRSRRAKAAEQVRATGQRLMEQVDQGVDGPETGDIWTGGHHEVAGSSPSPYADRSDDQSAVPTPS